LYCLKRGLPPQQCFEKVLVQLPEIGTLQRTLKALVDDKIHKAVCNYPTWALINTLNSLLEGALIAHFAAFCGRKQSYDKQWNKTFSQRAAEHLAGCNRTPGTEGDFAVKRWRYEPKEGTASKKVRTLEELIPALKGAAQEEKSDRASFDALKSRIEAVRALEKAITFTRKLNLGPGMGRWNALRSSPANLAGSLGPNYLTLGSFSGGRIAPSTARSVMVARSWRSLPSSAYRGGNAMGQASIST
jgi:hypothetical protein